jgi:hypothetical protein
MPAGYPIANDLDTNSAQQGLSAAMGKKLAAIARNRAVIVAASDASDEEKLAADYQCTGTNDELVIQQAVNAVYAKGGGEVLLSNGTFSIDSFPNYDANNDGGSYVAVMLPYGQAYYNIRITGTYSGVNSTGTTINVSDSCYEGLSSSTHYKIFSSTFVSSIIGTARITLIMTGLHFQLPWNQKKIMCIDLHSVNRPYLSFIKMSAARAGYNGWEGTTATPPAVAVEGCIGLRMTGGSNAGTICDYRNILAYAFHEGFQVGGEHVVGINLAGICNVYSFTFGNYPFSGCFIHPITLINCCDERTVNLPLFADCGDSRYKASEDGGQQVSIIDYNLERYPTITPGLQLGELATELRPGHFHGEISYTIMTGTKNSKTEKFWKDGHGQRFITRNSAHLLAGGSTERRSYAPNYLQRYWDTDAGKELICTDTANKTWRDTAGNIVT